MKVIKIIIVLSLFFCSCKSQNCNDLKSEFKNFNEAETLIKKKSLHLPKT